MDLPEIRAAVGQYMRDSDLAVAATICKSWNGSFSRMLYSVVNWSRSGEKPSKEAIAANSAFVQEFHLTPMTKMSDVEFLYSYNELRFPALRKLVLEVRSTFPIEHQLGIIRKCPQLQELDWSISVSHKCSVSDVLDIFRLHCPLVEIMRLNGFPLTDEDLSQILDNCRRVTSFTIFPSRFGEQAFQSLARHYRSLRIVSIHQSTVTSKMSQTILTNCPNLTTFHGGYLDARDILGVHKNNATGNASHQPPEWICSNLHSLGVTICGLEGKPLEWHRRVMQQIARMKGLITLTVSTNMSRINEESRDGLDLRLVAGLDLLSSLKKLRLLYFNGLWQQMDEVDVVWMRDTLPTGMVIVGKLHHCEVRSVQLKRVLKENGEITHF